MSVPDETKPCPKDLVMLQHREVTCDDTMREFMQVLRFDLVDMTGYPLRSQLLLDRRHKLNKGLSQPVAYFRMSSTRQLLGVSSTSLVVAVTLAFAEEGQLQPTDDKIRSALKSYWEMEQPDILDAVKVMLREVRNHRSTQTTLLQEARP